MDQTVVAARISNDPVTRGYRVYYGENEEKNDEVLSEVNMEDTFGYEETKDKDLKGTLKQLEKMGIEDPVNKLERAKKLGKRKDTKIVKNKKGEKIIKNLNLFEKETLDEIKRQKMIKMVEDIITQKEKGDSDIVNKDSAISRILSKNLEAIKKLAEKEGISLNKLINILKKGE
jgi:predicted DNA binding CopG/RHH family protein